MDNSISNNKLKIHVITIILGVVLFILGAISMSTTVPKTETIYEAMPFYFEMSLALFFVGVAVIVIGVLNVLICLSKNNELSDTASNDGSQQPENNSLETAKTKLEQLQKLKDDNLINENEYQELRSRILSNVK